MSVKNDDLRRMLHVALGVPVGAAEGVTTVKQFLAWVDAAAAVAGEAAVCHWRAACSNGGGGGESSRSRSNGRGRRRGGRGGGSVAPVT